MTRKPTEVSLPPEPREFINKVKARLGSISKRKRSELLAVSEPTFMLLEADIPTLIALYQAAVKPEKEPT